MQHRRTRAAAVAAAVLLLLGLTQLLPLSVSDAGAPAPPECAVIDNGTVRMGINPEGHLNCGDEAIEGGFTYGITYLPSGATADALSPGCECEGWGAGDAIAAVEGSASVDNDASFNMEVESFTASADSATSIVDIPTIADPLLRVTHAYHPSPVDELMQVDVTIENTSEGTVTPVYRRAMDWDIPPTEFDEFVTIQGSAAASDVTYASDDGFADVSPFAGPSFIDFEGDAVDNGPDDHGALFDFEFADLAPGESKDFTIYYGAAGNEDDADAALATVGAEMYSYGQANVEGGPETGVPNTFIFAFQGVGGLLQFPSVQFGSPTYTVDEAGGSAVIDVVLSGPAANPVEVDYATADGSATAGEDYEATSGTLTIPAGEASGTFSIPITEDDLDEPDETVNLSLSNPSGATPGDPMEAVLTITNVTPPAPPAPPVTAPPDFTG